MIDTYRKWLLAARLEPQDDAWDAYKRGDAPGQLSFDFPRPLVVEMLLTSILSAPCDPNAAEWPTDHPYPVLLPCGGVP